MEYSHSTYLSALTWRYGSDEMREIFSEEKKRKLLRSFWVSLAKAECKAGIVKESDVKELEREKDNINIEKSGEIEREISHDLMAEIKAFAELCPNAGGIIHLGCTSSDALDNTEVMRQKEALSLIIARLITLIKAFTLKAGEYIDTPTMAFTHLQVAEPTTIGYRLSQTLQDLLQDYGTLSFLLSSLKGKGLKGAVGTYASFSSLLEGSGITVYQLESMVMEDLGLSSFAASSQVYTRKQDLSIISSLSSLAATLHKFFFDLRLLSSPLSGEISESFGEKQVGSSAMPFKRNPINSEKICSLSRSVQSLYQAAWSNAALSLLERTLDDSASRRLFIPEAFILTDEILLTGIKVVSSLVFDDKKRENLLSSYAPFSATERLLMLLVKKGADRQKAHEEIRKVSLSCYSDMEKGLKNPMLEKLTSSPYFLSYLDSEEIEQAMNIKNYTGLAKESAEKIINRAKEIIENAP